MNLSLRRHTYDIHTQSNQGDGLEAVSSGWTLDEIIEIANGSDMNEEERNFFMIMADQTHERTAQAMVMSEALESEDFGSDWIETLTEWPMAEACDKLATDLASARMNRKEKHK